MTRPKILRRLRINEVSSVDRGAGEGVKIVLMKRDPSSSISRTAMTFDEVMISKDAAEQAADRAQRHRTLMSSSSYYDGDTNEDTDEDRDEDRGPRQCPHLCRHRSSWKNK
jgi:hypothetical protein